MSELLRGCYTRNTHEWDQKAVSTPPLFRFQSAGVRNLKCTVGTLIQFSILECFIFLFTRPFSQHDLTRYLMGDTVGYGQYLSQIPTNIFRIIFIYLATYTICIF